jgi:glycosidase
VCVRIAAGVDQDIEAAVLTFTTDGSEPEAPGDAPLGEMRRVLEPAGVRWETLPWGYVREWAVTLPGQVEGTMVRYRIAARTRQGRWVDILPRSATTTGKLSPIQGYHVDRLGIPVWLGEAVIYHVLVDRFAADPPGLLPTNRDLDLVHGGTLRGLTARLDYLASLGVNCLWLSPIHPSPSYHGYDPTDLAGINPRLGTLADWNDLRAATRDHGIRLLMDFVPNHVSNQHPLFQAASREKASPYRDWFHFEQWPGRYRAFFALPGMPVWNTSHPGVRDHLTRHALLWLERGCDGFRLDHAHGPGPAFWAEFRARVRAAHPDCVLLGEVTDPPNQLREYVGKLDGCLDFLLAEGLRGFFATGQINAESFAVLLERHYTYFANGMALPSFLDNHDMNRFLWLAKGDATRLRLAALCHFTLPGTPIVYYGTEVGLSQRKSVGYLEEARLPMIWGDQQDQGLRDFYQKLIALRRSAPQGLQHPVVPLLADSARGLLAYRVGPYVVAFNTGEKGARIDRLHLGAGRVLFEVGEVSAASADAAGLDLPARSGVVLGR